MKAPTTDMKVLTAEEIQWVSGGLNPQPLPPIDRDFGRIYLNPQPLPP
jgi:hypothetical protein